MDNVHLTKDEIKRFLIEFKQEFDITKDVYFHIDNYGVSSNYFKFEDKKNGYYTTYNTPESVRLEKCLQNILVDKIREIRKDDTAHIISFINVSYDNNKKIVLTMAIATKALI
jgi:hypothetical protein